MKEGILHSERSVPSAPRNNLAEVIHAGWAHRDSRGLSPLQSTYCDTRDSILLASEIDLFETGSWKGGSGPNFDQVDIQKNARLEERAASLGAELINIPNIHDTESAGQKPPALEELDSLVEQGILSQVTYPTDWVNSCVCVTKRN